eukprot:m.368833 g.368833  ORF g.368833 m.368833 type:complete len:62 (-) comp16670_c0_seq3:839-1024(-)
MQMSTCGSWMLGVLLRATLRRRTQLDQSEPRNMMIHVLIHNVAKDMDMVDEQLYVPEGYFQ